MRRISSIHLFVLAALLAASQLVVARHVSSHIDFKAGNCEWCICQAQTLAGPLPSAVPLDIERQITLLAPAVEIPFPSQSVATGYQSRAPPVFS